MCVLKPHVYPMLHTIQHSHTPFACHPNNHIHSTQENHSQYSHECAHTAHLQMICWRRTCRARRRSSQASTSGWRTSGCWPERHTICVREARQSGRRTSGNGSRSPQICTRAGEVVTQCRLVGKPVCTDRIVWCSENRTDVEAAGNEI